MSDYPPLYRSRKGYEAVMAMYAQALALGPVAYESRTVNTRHGKTQVVSGGPEHAPPILVFHGWNGNAPGAGADFSFLFDAFRVYLPDIIGHAGKSAPNRPATRGSTYADWACDVLDELGLQQTTVMGISGGGWMTLKFAAYYPARVTRAIAISTDGLSPTQTWAMLRGMLPVALIPNRTTARWFMEFVTSPNTPKGEPTQKFGDAMQILLKHFKTQGNPGQLTDDELRQMTSPLLVLMGEYERIFSSQIAIQRAKRLIPGLVAAELVPNAGHLMTADQPQWLKERIFRFMQEAK